MNRSYLSFFALVLVLALSSPAVLAEEMTDTSAEDATTEETTTDSSEEESAEEETVAPADPMQMMRDALMKNREVLRNARDKRDISRAARRTLQRTEVMRTQRSHFLKVKTRQEERVERRQLDHRLGGPNAGIRRQGIRLETQRIENNASRTPVGRMRLFPHLFQD